MLGADSPAIAQGRVSEGLTQNNLIDQYASSQTISGTGACRLGADFLFQFARGPVYISNPTWANHRAIFGLAGFTDIREYPYWDPKKKGLALEAMLKCFKEVI